MAKGAYVLLGILEALKDHIKDLKARITDLESSAGDLKILEVNGTYQICAFERREDGAVIGRVVADSITSFDDARLLASSAQARRLLELAIDRVDDGTEGGDQLWRQVLGCLQYVSNFENFKESFGGNTDEVSKGSHRENV